jgi:hypothetical protein
MGVSKDMPAIERPFMVLEHDWSRCADIIEDGYLETLLTIETT